MTFLEITNEVLRRLRENTVSTVNQTAYSRLIGYYINDTKRQVEDAWNWIALSTSTPVVTSAGTTTYTVTGSGIRQKDVTVNITTSGNQASLTQVSPTWIQNQRQLTTVQSSRPCYFAWVGTDGTDGTVELFPTPDGTYTLMFNMTVPQVNLSVDADVLTVPTEPVIAGAVARALVERGEDGGLSSGEAYNVFKNVLSDYISIEMSRDASYDSWVVV